MFIRLNLAATFLYLKSVFNKTKITEKRKPKKEPINE